MVSERITAFSSRDAVVCRKVGKTWSPDTPRAHEALRQRPHRSAVNDAVALRRDPGPLQVVIQLLPHGLGLFGIIFFRRVGRQQFVHGRAVGPVAHDRGDELMIPQQRLQRP